MALEDLEFDIATLSDRRPDMTRAFFSALLYAAFVLGANPVLAAPLDRDTLLEMRKGETRKLAIHKTPEDLPIFTLLDMEDNERSMDEFKGKYVVMNFWATWCAPCRKEMPSLEKLQARLGSDEFEVVLIAAGRNPKPAIAKFFKEINMVELETLRDPTQQLTNLMGVFGLPLTVILNPEGQEIARMRGDADWSAEEVIEFLEAMVAGDGA
jgi:thiol-disulfide isomerase/thioredoxin